MVLWRFLFGPEVGPTMTLLDCITCLSGIQVCNPQKSHFTFGDNFLHSHLIPSDAEDPADETDTAAGSCASSTGSRTRPRSRILPTSIKKFLHFHLVSRVGQSPKRISVKTKVVVCYVLSLITEVLAVWLQRLLF